MTSLLFFLVLLGAPHGMAADPDPCVTRTVLDEPWRSTSNPLVSSPHCDNDLNGWYQFVGSGGVQIPESCVPELRCNTHAPVWMNGTHPVLGDGIVNRTACANWNEDCCTWSSTIQVKACPQGYYVYKLTGTPQSVCSLTYCTVSDPCVTRTILDEPWRSTNSPLVPVSSSASCDLSKNGWYQFVGSGGVRIPESCVPVRSCNTQSPLWMNGTHPVLGDGIVSRMVCANWNENCCTWSSTIQVKACPQGYYVYKITGTPQSKCPLSYCTADSDPCVTRTVLDEPWRSTSSPLVPVSSSASCDLSKNGWYQFVGSGGVRIPESCVAVRSCNTQSPLWMNGTHPVLGDGIVSRTACANWNENCCTWSSTIQVKACPQGYYVYYLSGTPQSKCPLSYCTVEM